jgi:multisubunit Na+/H+ antiporter MnhC subunit
MELFLGVEAIAGLCCIISEILMILSLHVFEKKEDKLSFASEGLKAKLVVSGQADISDSILTSSEKERKQNLPALGTHALVVTVLVVNMQHLPFLGILPVFLTAGMNVMDTLTHWFAACVSIGIYTLAFAFFKAR